MIKQVSRPSNTHAKLLTELFRRDPNAGLSHLLTLHTQRKMPNTEGFDFYEKLKGDKGDSIKGDKGDEGYTPTKGKDYFTQKEIDDFISFCVSKIEKGADGEDGKDGEDGQDGEDAVIDIPAIIKQVLSKIPTPKNGEDGKDAEIDEESVANMVIEKIQKEKLIDISHIKNAQQFMFNNKKYKIEELMHGGGGSSGGGFTKLTATETVNGILATFTFSKAKAQPSFIISDGVWLTPTDNTVAQNVLWTWNSSTKQATLTTPPQYSITGII